MSCSAAQLAAAASMRFMAALLWLLSVVDTAAAQPPERIAVILADCRDNTWQRDMLELLRVELQVDTTSQLEVSTTPALAESMPALWVQGTCTATSGTPLQLRSSNPRKETVLERTLSLHDVPVELRSRVVALALAELLRASWPTSASALPLSAAAPEQQPAAQTEVSVVPPQEDTDGAATGAPSAPSPVDSSPAAPGQPQRAATLVDANSNAAEAPEQNPSAAADLDTADRIDANQPAQGTGISLALGPALHISLRGAPVLYGAELSLSWWRLSFGALGYLRNVSDDLGDIAIKRVHAFAAFELLRVAHEPWTWSAAVRGAAGGTLASASAASAALSTGSSDFTWDGSLETSLALRVAPTWAARLRANLGMAYAPAYRADARVIADYSGLFTALSLSLVHSL